MIRILLAGVVALGLAGCHSGQVTVTADASHVHDHNCGHYWDGHGWLIVTSHVHRSGCGHYHHHGQWHLNPESHVYREASYGHFGVTIERSHDEKRTPSEPRKVHEDKPEPPKPHKPDPHKPGHPK